MGDAPSRLAGWANQALETAWRRKLLPRPVLDADALESTALDGRDPASLGPDTGWRGPMRLLVGALRDEANLNPLGLSMAHGQIVQMLRARMRAVALWARHPEILEQPLAPPIVIVGPMRSGTTRLQRLLACDARLSHTRMFETLHPIPFGRVRGGADSRPIRTRLALAALERFNPAVAAIHPTGPYDPEEEFGLFSFSFGSPQFEAQWRIPSFTSWWESADKTFLYNEIQALLQTIAWRRDDPAGRPWILKAPQFMEDLPALLQAFPGARLLCLERDIEKVVASSASLVWNQMRIQSDAADPDWIGQEWLRKTRLRQRIAAETRRARSDVPQLDLHYEAMDRDWRAEMRRIYDFLERDLTPDLEHRMATYLDRARGHHGHRYSLAQFGLTSERVAGRA
jgi:hypothetical protein